MRFDIVLNNLCGVAWTTGEIRMESDGTPWRPLVHVRDISAAIALALEAPREAVHDEILNVGDRDGNYQIAEIAATVGKAFAGCEVTIGDRELTGEATSLARRSTIATRVLSEWDIERGAHEPEVFSAAGLTEADFRSRLYTRLDQIEHLRATHQLDESFHWRPLVPEADKPMSA
jgi:nucleoside-diphosphate-sugar epimerase